MLTIRYHQSVSGPKNVIALTLLACFFNCCFLLQYLYTYKTGIREHRFVSATCGTFLSPGRLNIPVAAPSNERLGCKLLLVLCTKCRKWTHKREVRLGPSFFPSLCVSTLKMYDGCRLHLILGLRWKPSCWFDFGMYW